MTNLIRRQATALKNFLLKALLPVQAAFAAACDALPSGSLSNGGEQARAGFRRDQLDAMAPGSRFGFRLLFLFALSMGAASSAQAATLLCSAFPNGVVDGYKPADNAAMKSATTFGIDRNCTIKNFPQSDALDLTLINFNFPSQASYLIVFDNVYYTGGMSCNDPTQSDFWMWWVNSSYNTIDSKCQAFLLPVDAIQKLNPAGQTTAAIGVPFTYTLTMPLMAMMTTTGYVYQDPVTDDAPLADVRIVDDLTKTGADLSVVGAPKLYWKGTGTQLVEGTDYTYTNVGGVLTFHIPSIPSNKQVVIEVPVVLNDSATNVPGTQFQNTATWTFDKTINGTLQNDLTGQNGVTEWMTIVGPNLVTDKSSTVTNLNVNGTAPFKIDVQNTGTSDAWNATIQDVLPSGMCLTSPLNSLSVTVASTVLVSGTDYTATYSSSTCTLELALKDTVKVAPGQRLVVNYNAQFDPGTTPTGTFTNVAGATDWYSDISTNTLRKRYGPYTLTNGTIGTADFQDAYTVNAAVVGYYLLKSVENVTTGTVPRSALTLAIACVTRCRSRTSRCLR